MKIAIGADHRGAQVSRHLGMLLADLGHEVLECNGGLDPTPSDYPDYALPVAEAVAGGHVDSGILIGGSGVGMSIVANKVKGVRAALVHDEVSAEMSRRHNNANVLCLGADMLGPRIIRRIITTWTQTGFEGGRHARRVAKITDIEQNNTLSSSSSLEATHEQ